jgi:hypothetical protein
LAKSFDLVEDRVGRRSPDKRLARVIVMRQIVLNRHFERPHILERAPSDPLGGDSSKETLDLIQPSRAGGGEVQVIPRVPGKPAGHLGHFVRPVIVHDDVHVAARRQLAVEPGQNLEKLLVPMASMTLPNHLAGREAATVTVRRTRCEPQTRRLCYDSGADRRSQGPMRGDKIWETEYRRQNTEYTLPPVS